MLSHKTKFCWWCHRQKLWWNNLYLKLSLFQDLEKPILLESSKLHFCLLKPTQKLKNKNYKLCIKMQSTCVLPDTTKVANFRWKSADVSRNQGVCHVIFILFGSFLRGCIAVPSFIIVGFLWQVKGRGGNPPSLSRPEKVHPE